MEPFPKPWYLLDYAVNELVLLTACEERELGTHLDSVLPVLKRKIGADLCIGISRTCADLQEVPRAYGDARAATRLSFLYGSQQVFYSRDIDDGDSRAARLSALQHTSLYDNLRIGAFSEVVDELPTLVAQFRDGDMALIAAVMHNVVLTACAIVTELGYNVFDIFGQNFNPVIDLNDFDSFSHIERWLHDFFVTIDRAVAARQSKRKAMFAAEMKRFVDDNYEKPLSLEILARRFCISPSYVSVLFSGAAGKNFTDYVTDVRVTAAKQLLRHSGMHVYEIAEEVGFRDAYYFSTCFKKATGRTPSEYRKGGEKL